MKMNFKPLNRYIEIETQPAESPQTQSGILLPCDFKTQEALHACVKVKAWDSEVRFADSLNKNSWMVVDKSMIQEVSVQGATINLILDNYVLGLITE
jgi:co-chaperonin GroES (HSP10)